MTLGNSEVPADFRKVRQFPTRPGTPVQIPYLRLPKRKSVFFRLVVVSPGARQAARIELEPGMFRLHLGQLLERFSRLLESSEGDLVIREVEVAVRGFGHELDRAL